MNTFSGFLLMSFAPRLFDFEPPEISFIVRIRKEHVGKFIVGFGLHVFIFVTIGLVAGSYMYDRIVAQLGIDFGHWVTLFVFSAFIAFSVSVLLLFFKVLGNIGRGTFESEYAEAILRASSRDDD